MSVTPRRPLAVQPHPYIGDVVGRPLDRGMIYFGEPDKDPQDYPITVYLDPEQTKPAHQPIRTKGGFINVFGDITEIFADEILYSLKVLDCYGRLVFYKKRMHRDNITEELGGEIVRAQKAESALQSSIDAEAVRAKAAESDLNADIIKEVSDRESEVTRLDEADAVLQAQINSVGGGKLAYKTYAEMVEDKSNIAAKSSIDIIADTEDKNGTYLYDGANFVKSQYDLEKLIRAKVQNTFGTYAQMVASNLSDGAYALVADDAEGNNGVYIKDGGVWSRSKYDIKTLIDNVNRKVGALSDINLFPNPDYTGSEITVNGHSVEVVDGVPEMVLQGGDFKYSIFSYGSDLFVPNSKFSLHLDAKVAGGIVGSTVAVVFFNGESQISSVSASPLNALNTWESITLEGVVPANTTKAEVRFSKRIGSTESRFKGVSLFVDGALVDYGIDTLKKDIDQTSRIVNKLKDSEEIVNLFPTPDLSDKNTTLYESQYISVTKQDGVYIMQIGGSTSHASAFYKIPLNTEYTDVGNVLDISVEMQSDPSGTSAFGDMSIQVFNKNSEVIYTKQEKALGGGQWHKASIEYTVQEGAEYLYFRMVHRGNSGGVDYTRFKNPSIINLNAKRRVSYPLADNSEGVSVGKAVVFVNTTGSDTAPGTESKPVKTLTKALSLIGDSGTIVVQGGGDFRESVDINKAGHVEILSSNDSSINIFGSDILDFSNSSGNEPNVYNAPLSVEPKGTPIVDGVVKGLPLVFIWGKPSKPIPENEAHPLHHGASHRLPYTELFAAESKATMQEYSWWWESNMLYVKLPSDINANQLRMEARVRPTLTHSGGSIKLTRVNAWFSTSHGMQFGGQSVERNNCKAFGSILNGFADNSDVCISYNDEAGGCGNDGFNGAKGDNFGIPEMDSRGQITLFDPYGHDNSDDGFSCHRRVDATVFGGLFEHNVKADVIHVGGSNCICYNTETRGTGLGFSSRGAVSGAENHRVRTMFKCVGTISRDNGIAYNGSSTGNLICENTLADEPRNIAYEGTSIARNARYKITNGATPKSSTVTVESYNLLD